MALDGINGPGSTPEGNGALGSRPEDEIDDESLAWLRQQVGSSSGTNRPSAAVADTEFAFDDAISFRTPDARDRRRPAEPPQFEGGGAGPIEQAIDQLVDAGGSDLHLRSGESSHLRVNGRLRPSGSEVVGDDDFETALNRLLSPSQREQLQREGECEVMIDRGQRGRFRMAVFRHQNRHALAVRAIPADVPRLESLNLPAAVTDLADLTSGLVLVTGPSGSGKSTTLAAVVDHINRTKSSHIVTIEDPIEYRHRNNTALVAQREVGTDTASFAAALRAALRQDPDVIMIGEMRDLETIRIALTAAETGHLVLATLHSSNASSTIHRVIDVFPGDEQSQVRAQLSGVLQGIISQQLVPGADGASRHVATEVLMATGSVRNQIRESKTHQLISVIETGGADGMHTMTRSLELLVKQGLVSADDAASRAPDGELLRRRVSQ